MQVGLCAYWYNFPSVRDDVLALYTGVGVFRMFLLLRTQIHALPLQLDRAVQPALRLLEVSALQLRLLALNR